MRTTIDKAGRLVLPKDARDRLGISPGDQIEIEPVADGLQLTVVHESPRLVREGRLLVFAGGKLQRQVTDAVGEHRDDRIAQLVRQAMQ